MAVRGKISSSFKEKKKITIYLPLWVIKKVQSVEEITQSKFIENSIIKANKWEKPNASKK